MEAIRAAREEAVLDAGLARIRRRRLLAVLAIPAAVVAIATGPWIAGLGFPCVPIGLGVFAVAAGLAYGLQRCPRCGARIVLARRGEAAGPMAPTSPWWRTSACPGCGLAFDAARSAG